MQIKVIAWPFWSSTDFSKHLKLLLMMALTKPKCIQQFSLWFVLKNKVIYFGITLNNIFSDLLCCQKHLPHVFWSYCSSVWLKKHTSSNTQGHANSLTQFFFIYPNLLVFCKMIKRLWGFSYFYFFPLLFDSPKLGFCEQKLETLRLSFWKTGQLWLDIPTHDKNLPFSQLAKVLPKPGCVICRCCNMKVSWN